MIHDARAAMVFVCVCVLLSMPLNSFKNSQRKHTGKNQKHANMLGRNRLVCVCDVMLMTAI